jgi:hypothetical protein
MPKQFTNIVIAIICLCFGNTIVAQILGTYPNTTLQAGKSTTVVPSAAPTATTSIFAKGNNGFVGTLSVHPTTGVVSISAPTIPGIYIITIKAYGSGTATASFTLTVSNPTTSLGNLGGTYEIPVGSGPSFTDGNPISSIVGDYNNDGYQDLLVALVNETYLQVMLGNGTGTFPTSVITNNVGVIVGVEVADFNGDGNLDILSRDNSTNFWTTRLGNGTGSFINHGTYINYPNQKIVVADINNDLIPDVVSLSEIGQQSYIRTYIGNGNGVFTFGIEYFFPFRVINYNIADINNDGNTDLILSNQETGTTTILTGDGMGTFGNETEYPDVLGFRPRIADFNEDGNQDILKILNNSFVTYYGNGNGSFTAGTSFSYPPDGLNPFNFGDANGDGHLDIICSITEIPNQVFKLYVYPGNGDGSFGTAIIAPAPLSARAVDIGDFNNDGYQDIAFQSNPVGVDKVYIRYGGNPIITVGGGSPLLTIANGDVTPSVQDNTDFGDVTNTTQKTLTYLIKNIGGGHPLTISSIIHSNPRFSTVVGTFTIISGNSALFAVKFSPLTVSQQIDTIKIFSNDLVTPVYQFVLQGNGVCIPADIVCPGNIFTMQTTGSCGVVVNYNSTVTGTAPVAQSYKLTGATTTCTNGSGNGSGTLFYPGTTIVTLYAASSCSATDSCTFTISVRSNNPNPPQINHPGNIILYKDPGICGTVVNNMPLSDFANCPNLTTTLVSGLPNGSVFPIGTTTQSYRTFSYADTVYNPETFFTENFNNNNQGWTLGTEWQIGPPIPISTGCFSDPAVDGSGNIPTYGGGLAGVVIGGYPDPETAHGYYYLTSPVINLSDAATAHLNFRRHLTQDYPFSHNIEVYNGTSWVVIWEVLENTDLCDGGWTNQTYNITPYINANLQVRYGFSSNGDGQGSTIPSWSIDNVTVKGIKKYYNQADTLTWLHTITVLDTTIDHHSACDTFTWINGTTYNANNSAATMTFLNPVCDSVLQLHLIINPAALPQTATISEDTLCKNQTTQVNLSGSQSIITYTLIDSVSNIPMSLPKVGNNGPINMTTFPLQNNSTIKVVAQNKGNSLAFNGSNQYLSAPLPVSGYHGTWEAWIQKENWSAFNDDRLFGNGKNFTEDDAFYVSLHPAVGYHFRYGKSGVAGNNYASNSVIPATFAPNSWHHMAATWRRVNGVTYIKLYIDGIQVAEACAPIHLNFGNNIYIGGGGTASNPYFGPGKMDDVRIWNYAKSANQILANMNACNLSNQKGLLAYYNFNNNTGNSVVADNSFEANNANMYNYTGNMHWTLNANTNCISCTNTIAYLQVVVKPTSRSINTITACAANLPYIWNGLTLSNTAVDSVLLVNALGCDSTAVIHFTVINNPAAPTGAITQTFCTSNVSIANLSATGTNIQWYATATSTTPLASGTPLVNTTYFASQTVNGCESIDRFITVAVIDTLTNSSINVLNDTICPNTSAVIIVPNTQSGKYYAVENAANNDRLSPLKQSIGGSLNISTIPLTSTKTVKVRAMHHLKSLSFDGVNDYINTTATAMGNAGTWEAWVKKTNWADHHDDRLFSNGINYDNNGSLYLSLHPVVGFHFRYGGGTDSGNNYVSNLATQSFAANSWHHLAASWQHEAGVTTLKIYIDGVLAGTSTSTLLLGSNTNIKIGGNGTAIDTTCFGNGAMYDVRMWNVVKSANEIATDYVKVLTGSEPGLTALYKFNEISGTTAADSSPNGNNGILTNMNVPTVWNIPICNNTLELSQIKTVTVGNFSSTTIIAACGEYTWPVNNQTYTTGGTYFVSQNCVSDSLHLSFNINPNTNACTYCPGVPICLTSNISGTTYQWQINTGSGYTNLTNGGLYQGVNTKALLISGALSNMRGTKYRCMVNGNTPSADNVLIFSARWNGAANTDWSNTANWDCGLVPDANVDVVVPNVANKPTVNHNVSCFSLTLDEGTAVTIAADKTLTILGN